MKNSYFTLLIIFSVTNLVAQPTLTNANNAPTVGEMFEMEAFEWDGTLTESGADLLWDFTEVVPLGTLNYNYIDKTEGGSYTSFPEATIAMSDGGTNYLYRDYTADAVILYGFYFDVTESLGPYHDPQITLTYPMTFGTTLTDDFATDYTSFEDEIERTGEITVTGTGYGTLLLPDATLTDVLLVKGVQNFQDDTGDGDLIIYEIVTYDFYKPGIHHPVLTLNIIIVDDFEPQYQGTFNATPNLTVENEQKLTFSTYPNPAEDVLNLTIDPTLTVQKINVHTMAGQLVFTINQLQNSIPTAHLPAGIYTITVEANTGKTVKKFVKN